MVAKQESDNSEDPQFISRVNNASDQVQASKCLKCTSVFYEPLHILWLLLLVMLIMKQSVQFIVVR